MKQHLDIKHEGSLGSEGRVRMTFDQDSITHLMRVLTDLYSDPEKAVIREYSTNAWDSHVAAGNTAPIEIGLPTAFAPVFTVTDYGVGLSTDEVTEHLTKYGWSSKRDTDEAVGMLGLGFKSALTYTSQFTLIARKNGLESTVLVTREDSGAGVVQVIDTCGTSEPNGVVIQIPVRNYHSFNQKANTFYRFWEKGTVLVDGAEPEPWEGSALDPDGWITVLKNGELPTDYLVMGNVPYPVPTPIYNPRGRYHGSGVRPITVVRVPIGAIDFTPNREALHMTKRTEEVLSDVRKYVVDCIRRQAQDEINASVDHIAARAMILNWENVLGERLPYKGDELPTRFHFGDGAYEWGAGNGVESPSSAQVNSVYLDQMLRTLQVTGYKSRGVTKLTKAKVRYWWEQKQAAKGMGGYPWPRVVFHRGNKIGGPFLADAPSVTFDEISNVVLPDSKVPVIKKRPKYSTLNRYGDVTGDEELEADVILWFESHMRWGRDTLMRVVYEEYEGQKVRVQVVSVPANRENKFKKDYPQAMHVGTWIKKVMQAFADDMTEAERWAFHTTMDRGESDRLRSYVPSGMLHKVMDPEYRDAVRELNSVRPNRDKDTWKRLESVKDNFARRGRITLPKPHPTNDFGRRISRIIKAYPLMQLTDSIYYFGYNNPRSEEMKKHYIEYLNSLYIVHNQLHLISTY